MVASVMVVARLRVHLSSEIVTDKLQAAKLTRFWYQPTSSCVTVADFEREVQDRFQPACEGSLVVSLDGFTVPLDSPISIFRDGDTVTLSKNDTEYLHSNGGALASLALTAADVEGLSGGGDPEDGQRGTALRHESGEEAGTEDESAEDEGESTEDESAEEEEEEEEAVEASVGAGSKRTRAATKSGTDAKRMKGSQWQEQGAAAAGDQQQASKGAAADKRSSRSARRKASKRKLIRLGAIPRKAGKKRRPAAAAAKAGNGSSGGGGGSGGAVGGDIAQGSNWHMQLAGEASLQMLPHAAHEEATKIATNHDKKHGARKPAQVEKMPSSNAAQKGARKTAQAAKLSFKTVVQNGQENGQQGRASAGAKQVEASSSDEEDSSSEDKSSDAKESDSKAGSSSSEEESSDSEEESSSSEEDAHGAHAGRQRPACTAATNGVAKVGRAVKDGGKVVESSTSSSEEDSSDDEGSSSAEESDESDESDTAAEEASSSSEEEDEEEEEKEGSAGLTGGYGGVREVEVEVPSQLECGQLPVLRQEPSLGMVVAYRLLEIGMDCCPTLSEYRFGKVKSTNSASSEVALSPWPNPGIHPLQPQLDALIASSSFHKTHGPPSDSEDPPLTFADLPFMTLYEDDGTLITHFSAFCEVRTVTAPPQVTDSSTPASTSAPHPPSGPASPTAPNTHIHGGSTSTAVPNQQQQQLIANASAGSWKSTAQDSNPTPQDSNPTPQDSNPAAPTATQSQHTPSPARQPAAGSTSHASHASTPPPIPQLNRQISRSPWSGPPVPPSRTSTRAVPILPPPLPRPSSTHPTPNSTRRQHTPHSNGHTPCTPPASPSLNLDLQTHSQPKAHSNGHTPSSHAPTPPTGFRFPPPPPCGAAATTATGSPAPPGANRTLPPPPRLPILPVSRFAAGTQSTVTPNHTNAKETAQSSANGGSQPGAASPTEGSKAIEVTPSGWGPLIQEMLEKKKIQLEGGEPPLQAAPVTTPGAVKPRGGAKRGAMGPMLSYLRTSGQLQE